MEPGAIYARISDDPESRELGVDDQVRQCRALARREGIKVDKRYIYVDNDLSASDVKRKGRKPREDYERMLAAARAGEFKRIISLSSSRLTRRPREHEDLIDLSVDHGVRYLFVKSPSFDLNTADGRMVARTLAAADAAEAERTAERVRDAAARRARSGDPHGSARAYGISADGRALVEGEAEVIRGWYAEVLAGASLHGICTEMQRAGIPTLTGVPWRGHVVRKILLNERNAGLRIVDGKEYKAPHPEIVPLETYRAVKDILEQPERLVNQVGTARKYLGTGLYWCQRCTRTVNSAYDVRGNRVYKCLKCWRSWRAEPIDVYVIAAVEADIAAEDAAERLLTRDPLPGIDVEKMRTEASAIKRNMVTFAGDLVLLQGASRAALAEGLAKGEKRLTEINAVLADAGRINPLAAVLLADDPVAAWRDIQDLARRQTLVRALMAVELGAPIRGRAKWVPEKFIQLTQA